MAPPRRRRIRIVAAPVPVTSLDFKIEWGSRSKALQARLSSAHGTSFLLTPPGAGPVKLGNVGSLGATSWDSATTRDIPVTRSGPATEVTATARFFTSPRRGPPGPNNLRLDFELTATAGGQTKTVLAFRQLLEVSLGGTVTGKQCAIDNVPLKPSPSGPVPSSTTPLPRRTFAGLHPLVTISQTATLVTISINAEFVDLTALWWSLHTDALGWYLNVALPNPGRQANLRVLGWTSGGNPMLWFAVIPDAAASAIAGAEDLVFFRPPPGINSFAYPPTEAGLTDSRHDGADPGVSSPSTLYMLGRYLLSPIPNSRLAAVAASGSVQRIDLLADQAQAPAGFSLPADPMPFMAGFPASFRPVGMESALNNVPRRRVLFLPLASGPMNDTYEGASLGGLQVTTRSALGTLWNVGAVDINGSSLPDLSARDLWLVGHSSGNGIMWSCAQNNKADVGRIITFDASPWSTNLSNGIPIITSVAATRKGASKTLDVFASISPNLSQSKNPAPPLPFMGIDDDTDLKLRHTGAAITVLPPFAERESYWNPTTVAPSTGVGKTFIQYLLSGWTPAQLAASAVSPAKWRFLFFHEQSMSGGTLVASTTPGVSPSIQSFFEQAMGAPNPRPP